MFNFIKKKIRRLFQKDKSDIDQGIFVYHNGTKRVRSDASIIAFRMDSNGLKLEDFFLYSKGFSELAVPGITEGQAEMISRDFKESLYSFQQKMRKVFNIAEVEDGGLSSVQLINLAADWILFVDEMSEKHGFFTNSSARLV